jgi:hypothetical protein
MSNASKSLASLLVALFLTTLVALPSTSVKANPYHFPAPPSITMIFPPDFFTGTIHMKLDITVIDDYNNCTREAWYSLDGQKNVSIPLTYNGMIGLGGYFPASVVKGEANLPIGSSIVKVFVKYNYGDFVLTGSKTQNLCYQKVTSRPFWDPPIGIVIPIAIMLVFAAFVLMAAIVSVLLYRRHRRTAYLSK